MRLELFGQCRDALGARAQGRRRADHGEGRHELRTARREGTGDDAADLGAHQMEPLSSERIHETRVVVDDDVERPWKVARHRRRRAVAAHVRPHDAEPVRQQGHPRVPRLAALGVAVQEDDRFRPAPGLGEVVDQIVQPRIGRHVERRHHDPPARSLA
jgi:hypothetical protein